MLGFKKTTATEIVSTTNFFYLRVLSFDDHFTAAGIIAILNVIFFYPLVKQFPRPIRLTVVKKI